MNIFKSKIDTRVYKAVELPNKLLCLLISDKDTEKSGAALNVDVGSLEDPVERQGLAHFCEHMLFMGTEKYPLESEYQDYISKNSGSTNAFTSALNTNFIFQVANNAFHGALDRFAQFFTTPLFSDSCTEREMKAVDSEFNLNLQNDFWRKYQLFHGSAKQGSQYQKFMIGNLKTLQFPDTRQYLLDFHKKYYSANVMRLVIYGQQPIQELEQWAHDLFSHIPNKDLTAPNYSDNPFPPECLGQLFKYVPVKDQDYLELSWILEDLHPHYKQSPGSYVSHLLGHEGENSLLSLLIDEGLAQELSCGPSNEMKQFSLLNVRIKLTKQGLNEVERVVGFVFQYLNLLRYQGTQKWVFDEIKAVRSLQFDYLEKSTPFNYVSSLASRLQLYPVEEVLKAPYFMEEYNENLIRHTINQLNEKNVMVFVSSKDFAGKLQNTEEYFGTEYSKESLPESYLNQMLEANPKREKSTKKMDLPLPNIFLPKTTEVLAKAEAEYPQITFENEQSTLYFKQDNKFQVPKAVVQLRVYCNKQLTDQIYSYQSLGYGQQADTEVLARIWLQLLKDHVREFNYLAEMAYIEPSIDLSANGMDISINGFNDSMPIFIHEMFKKIKTFSVAQYQDKFPIVYTRVKENLQNFYRQPPYQQIYSYSSTLLRNNGSFEPNVLLNILNAVKYEDLLKFESQWLRTCRYEWLIQGNLTKETAVQIVQQTQELLNAALLPKEQVLEIRALNIPTDVVYNFNYQLQETTETNSAVLLHYQQETLTLKNQIINDLIANIMKSPFFQQLRTVEQLGYVVFSLISDIRGITGFNFLIQSNVQPPQYVQQRIRFSSLFVNEQMNKSLKEMTNEQFEQYRESVKIALLEKDYSLNQEAGKFWNELQKHQNLFDRRAKLLELLPSITLEEVQQFYEQHFIASPKVIEIHAIAPNHVEENQKLNQGLARTSNNVDWIRRRLPLYPDYYSQL